MEASGILLMLMLGLRHGFDPDHIAIIDGVSVRLSHSRPGVAKWSGTLFAIGHGSVVTAIAVMISCFSHAWNFSAGTWRILEWAPGIVLIIVGLLNLRMLLKGPDYKPKGLKMHFVPQKLRESSNPLAIVAIGILFAMVFDTNTQAAAWAYTSSSELSVFNALVLGLSFSVGMVITDTMDSRILYLLMRRSVDRSSVRCYRRRLGWLIAIVSLVMGGYKILSLLYPALELEDNLLTVVGLGFFGLMLVFYAYAYFSKSLAPQGHGN